MRAAALSQIKSGLKVQGGQGIVGMSTPENPELA